MGRVTMNDWIPTHWNRQWQIAGRLPEDEPPSRRVRHQAAPIVRRARAPTIPVVPLMVLSTALAVVVGEAVGRGMAPDKPDRPAPAGGPPLVVRTGDRVVATGMVMADADGNLRFCVPAPRRLVDDGRPPSCSPLATPLRGLAPAAIPSWVGSGGAGYALDVTIFGTWAGDGIDAERAITGSLATEPDPIECPGPAVGPRPEPGDLRQEAALGALSEEVFGQRDRYGGFWRSRFGHIVVGVAGDAAAEEARLRRLYPYALCLVRVPNSLSILDGAAATLEARLESGQLVAERWLWSLDMATNRVRVPVLVVDEATAALLHGLEGQITLDPVVRPDRG
jgi:hypothetical protein